MDIGIVELIVENRSPEVLNRVFNCSNTNDDDKRNGIQCRVLNAKNWSYLREYVSKFLNRGVHIAYR